VRDYIHVSDLVSAHHVALGFLRDGGRKFTANCGYSRGFSVLEVIKAIKRVSGRDFRVAIDQRRAGDVALVVANSHRLQSRLGWKPRHDNLDFILSTALAWEERLQERLLANAN
jgi:UDP-glucose 4-epimerase